MRGEAVVLLQDLLQAVVRERDDLVVIHTGHRYLRENVAPGSPTFVLPP